MDRRSPRQKAIDDAAFPVRVRALVPERGFENLLLDIDRWLEAEVGRGNFAGHSARLLASDATAWYFRCVEDARSFVAAFPQVELADGTELPTYQSPHLPFGRGADWSDPVCNLYSMLKSQEAMRRLFDGLIDRAGNMPPLPGIYPDYGAPIVRNGAEGRELVMARWGMPTPPQYLAGKQTDPGVTNIRRVPWGVCAHWALCGPLRPVLALAHPPGCLKQPPPLRRVWAGTARRFRRHWSRRRPGALG